MPRLSEDAEPPPLPAAPDEGRHRGRQLLRAKLAPPMIRGDTIGRERLYAALERGRNAKLSLIHAPAGYGKTTLMVQWMKHLESAGERVAWIGLDSADNDASRLLAALQYAMVMDEHDQSLDLLALINRCATAEVPFTLFLDEVEVLTESAALQLVGQLLDYSPPNLRLVMGTRSMPNLPLARLRVRGDLVEVDGQALRFLLREAAQFIYVRCGIQLTKPALNELLERTEGWVAALQLLALSLGHGADRTSVMHHMTGSRTQVIEYLAVDVVDKLPQDVRDFLVQTSVLRRLCGPLCDAVTGTHNSAAMLQRLESANLFLLAVDPDREWYRYHALFADFLRTRLQQTQPDRAAEIARKAADWCAERGMLAESVEYSLQAQDVEAAIRRMQECVDEQIRNGQFRTLRNWLAALPDAAVERHPRLLIAKAWASTFCQQFALAGRLIEQLRRVVGDPHTSAAFRKTLLTVEPTLLISTGRLDLAMARAQEAWLEMDRDSPFERGRMATVLAYGCITAGRHEDAQRYLREAAACHSAPHPSVLGLAYGIGYSAFAESCLGNLGGAIHLLRSIDQLIAEHHRKGLQQPDPGFLPAFIIGSGAEMLYELNDLDEADEWLDRRFGLVDSIPTVQSIMLAYVIRARLCLARGERQEADDALLAGSRHSIRNGIDRLLLAVEWERVRIALVEGDVARAQILARSIETHPRADLPPTWIEPYDEVNSAGIETIRLHLHTGDVTTALTWLGVQIEHARTTLRRRRLLKLHVLEALARKKLGEDAAALEAMAEALKLGASTGTIRSFLDEGPACQQLLRALSDQRAARLDEKSRAHLRELLAAIDASGPGAEPAAPATVPAGLDTLSKREAQILQRLSQGYSNLAVAQQLFVSTHTVKWHLRQIYDKLGARNRSQAIFRARELGILQ